MKVGSLVRGAVVRRPGQQQVGGQGCSLVCAARAPASLSVDLT